MSRPSCQQLVTVHCLYFMTHTMLCGISDTFSCCRLPLIKLPNFQFTSVWKNIYTIEPTFHYFREVGRRLGWARYCRDLVTDVIS